jgi:hypothetical protein
MPVVSAGIPVAGFAGRTTISWPQALHFILNARPESSSLTA